MFKSGLIDDIHMDVELQGPRDLEHAYNLARAYEKKTNCFHTTGCFSTSRMFPTSRPTSTMPTALGHQATSEMAPPR